MERASELDRNIYNYRMSDEWRRSYMKQSIIKTFRLAQFPISDWIVAEIPLPSS